MSSLVVIATLELARAIVLEATLSFLGLGIQPPTPSRGGMIHAGREYLDSAWWISTLPGLLLMLTSLVVSRTGDWLRDVLDPTLRGESPPATRPRASALEVAHELRSSPSICPDASATMSR